jgi:hypothetical protein
MPDQNGAISELTLVEADWQRLLEMNPLAKEQIQAIALWRINAELREELSKASHPDEVGAG